MRNNKNIVLIGYRGVGKSFVSKRLCNLIDMEAVSCDDLIEKEIGPISSFVEKNGWDAFRDVESEVVKRCSEMTNTIIDCGGGIIERPINMENLRRNGIIFYMSANVSDIVKRIQLSGGRPSLLKDVSLKEEVKIVLTRRKPLYEKYADHILDTGGMKLIKTHEEIFEIYTKNS